MSTDTQIDYEAVLADLKERRAKLDVAIAGIEAMLGSSIGDAMASEARAIVPRDISDDTFLGMGIGDAARKFLTMMKRPQTTPQIADALKRGGIHSTAKHFSTTVYTSLSRQEDVLRLGDKWSLKEWHPNARSQKPKAVEADGSASETIS
jgi:DNA-binding transcriptional regulator LsrR (DeoR family)